MDNNSYQLDKSLVRASFDKAAPHYEKVAVLQREVGQRMMQRLELIKITPDQVLDIGSGTGVQSNLLAENFQHAQITSMDLSINMLHQGKKKARQPHEHTRTIKHVCGDAERLPFANESIDFIFSNLTLQWCNNLDYTFFEFQRVLKPGGLLLFSTLGPDTLHELRASWQSVDDHSHVNAFMDMHDIGDGLMRFFFADPVMDVENITLTYQDTYKLMKDLKTLGAHNVTAGRPAGLMTKSRLLKMQAAYEQYRNNGVLPASYEVIYGHAWKADENDTAIKKIPRRRQEVVTVSMSEIKRHTD